MTIRGSMFIGQREIAGSSGAAFAVDLAIGETLQPAFARRAARIWNVPARSRPKPLGRSPIMALGEALTARVMQESGLPRARLDGERGRACNPLRLFAAVLPRHRPVPAAALLQDMHDALLPDALKSANPLEIPRLVGGVLQTG